LRLQAIGGRMARTAAMIRNILFSPCSSSYDFK
jgi:hypothetical protein